MKYDIKINEFGDKFYYVNNVLHREDGPAIEYVDGEKRWYTNGKLHRDDGPAIESANGTKVWCKNGIRHRDVGPAAEYSNGARYWYLNDKLYGTNNDFTNESWQKFVKTLIFS